jgi:hypothetical protein
MPPGRCEYNPLMNIGYRVRADPFSPFSVEVKNAYTFNPIPTCVFMTYCVIKLRDITFTFTFKRCS